MKYTSSTDKQGIYEDIDFLCGSTSASYPIADKRRNVYQEYQRVATLIWDSDGTWGFDDSNTIDGSKATRTIANASATYQIPTTALRVEGVEILDNGSVWHKLIPIDYHDIEGSPEEFLKSAGLPTRYDLQGNEIRLFPPPGTGAVTLTSGMCVRLSRNVSAFASAATTSPGFAAPFHRLLSIGAALDFERDTQQRNLLLHMKDRLEKGLVKFYSKRGAEQKLRIKPYTKKRWRQYL